MQSNVRSLIAAKVRGEMARQGKSQRELSTALEIDQGSTSLRLQGVRSFRAEELVRVANWLGVPVSQFVDQDVAA